MWHFVGIELISDRILDETTILSIQHLLERQDLVQMKQGGMITAVPFRYANMAGCLNE